MAIKVCQRRLNDFGNKSSPTCDPSSLILSSSWTSRFPPAVLYRFFLFLHTCPVKCATPVRSTLYNHLFFLLSKKIVNRKLLVPLTNNRIMTHDTTNTNECSPCTNVLVPRIQRYLLWNTCIFDAARHYSDICCQPFDEHACKRETHVFP